MALGFYFCRVLTAFTIFYFDNYLFSRRIKNQYRLQIDSNLLEDKNRFLSFINDGFVKIDIILQYLYLYF